jgi:hypothetical protein
LNELIKLDLFNYHKLSNTNEFNQKAHSNESYLFQEEKLRSEEERRKDDELKRSLNIIVGVDFTASNEWKGRKTFNSQSLHKTLANRIYNPYQKVIFVLGNVLTKFLMTYSNTNIKNQHANTEPSSSALRIYAFGFGDSMSTDKSVISFFENNSYVRSFDEVLNRLIYQFHSVIL